MADKFNISVTASAAKLLRNPSAPNETQTVNNAGPGTVFTGQTSGVTAATGTPFPPGSEMRLLRNAVSLYAIAATGQVANIQVSAGNTP